MSGADPTAINLSDPLRLWIIQVVVIVFTSQLLGFFLRKIKQPSVIAEILAGIILGPTAMGKSFRVVESFHPVDKDLRGRIPGFTTHIFPAASLPFLSLTANIG